MNNLGLLLLDQGRAGDALPLLARAVTLGKDVAAFHNNLGMALEHTGRFSAAAAEYTGALTADPAYEKAKLNLARVEKVKEDAQEPFDLEAAAKAASSPRRALRTRRPSRTRPQPTRRTRCRPGSRGTSQGSSPLTPTSPLAG